MNPLCKHIYMPIPLEVITHYEYANTSDGGSEDDRWNMESTESVTLGTTSEADILTVDRHSIKGWNMT